MTEPTRPPTDSSALLDAAGEDVALVTSLIPALRRASALMRSGWSPWPPDPVPALDLAALARDLAWRRTIDRSVDVARIALAEADPALSAEQRAWLVAHAANEHAALGYPPETLGGLLHARALDGLEVEDGPRSLRIDWLIPYFSTKGQRGGLELAASLRTPDGTWRAYANVHAIDGITWGRPPEPGWRESAAAVLRSFMASGTGSVGDLGSGEELLDQLLAALTPGLRPGTVAHWVLTRGLELLRPDVDTPVATAAWQDVTLQLYIREASYGGHHRDGSLIRVIGRIAVLRDGALEDLRESEALIRPFATADFEAPAPTDETDARAAVTAWRAAMAEHLPRIAEHYQGALMPNELISSAFPLGLIADWIGKGPPGPRPEPVHRIVIDEGRIAAVIADAQRLDDPELERLRAEVDRQAAAAYAIAGWVVLFCPFHRTDGSTFEEDRIVIIPPGGAPVAIMMNDPWNGHAMPIDGDAEVFRGFARFWREVLRRGDLDADYVPRRDEDEDEDEDEGTSDAGNETGEADGAGEDDDAVQTARISDWLEFPLPDPCPLFPMIDWRLQDDTNDFIADFTFWDHGPFGMPPERRDVYRRAVESHYHAFIRAVIDPELPRTPLE